MIIANVSERGQISIPAIARRKLGIKPKSKVTVEIGEHEITIRPMRSISDVEGVFRKQAANKKEDWDKVRLIVERSVAEEVEDESRR